MYHYYLIAFYILTNVKRVRLYIVEISSLVSKEPLTKTYNMYSFHQFRLCVFILTVNKNRLRVIPFILFKSYTLYLPVSSFVYLFLE